VTPEQRQFCFKSERETYDVIVLDAFSGDTPPFHLLTQEAFQTLRDLAPDGLIVANIVGGVSGPGGKACLFRRRDDGVGLWTDAGLFPNWQLAARPSPFVSTMFLVAG
jgi:hypothetical protein